MQDALTSKGCLFDRYSYASVPNVVSYTFCPGYESDLMCLSKSGVLHEVEIKISKSDLIKDKSKNECAHNGPLTSYVWFAVPADILEKVQSDVAPEFGLVTVRSNDVPEKLRYYTRVIRRPVKRTVPGLSVDQREQFLRIGVARMWLRRTGY